MMASGSVSICTAQSAEPERPHLEESHTWVLHARFRFTGDRNVSHVLADRDDRRETYLQAASLIAYACSDISATGTMQAAILVQAKPQRNIRRGRLQSWLDIDVIQELEELDIKPIPPGMSKSFMSHSTVQRFYAETVLAGDPAAAGAGKRIRVIHHGTKEVKKAERPKGSTKEAMAAAKAAALGAAAPATPAAAGDCGSVGAAARDIAVPAAATHGHGHGRGGAGSGDLAPSAAADVAAAACPGGRGRGSAAAPAAGIQSPGADC